MLISYILLPLKKLFKHTHICIVNEAAATCPDCRLGSCGAPQRQRLPRGPGTLLGEGRRTSGVSPGETPARSPEGLRGSPGPGPRYKRARGCSAAQPCPAEGRGGSIPTSPLPLRSPSPTQARSPSPRGSHRRGIARTFSGFFSRCSAVSPPFRAPGDAGGGVCASLESLPGGSLSWPSPCPPGRAAAAEPGAAPPRLPQPGKGSPGAPGTCPAARCAQGQAGPGSERPGLVGGVPAQGRGMELHRL